MTRKISTSYYRMLAGIATTAPSQLASTAKTLAIMALMVVATCFGAYAESLSYLIIHENGGGSINVKVGAISKITLDNNMLNVFTEKGIISRPFQAVKSWEYADNVMTGIAQANTPTADFNFVNGLLTVHGMQGQRLTIFNDAGIPLLNELMEETHSADINSLPVGVYIVNLGDRAFKIRK